MIRLHVAGDLAEGAPVDITPEQARYLLTVMRRGVGDELLLFNGRHGEWRARIAEAGRRGCRVQAVERTRVQTVGPDLELVAALVKRARLETIVEKAAELGAARVRLAVTRRTQADHTNVARLQAIAVEAAEQTGRLDVPEVAPPQPLERLLDDWAHGRALVFCDEAGVAPAVLEALKGIGRNTPAALIGPEGGCAPEERARLTSLPYVTAVSLGPRILRADTAAVAALTLWQAAAGDWRDGLPPSI